MRKHDVNILRIFLGNDFFDPMDRRNIIENLTSIFKDTGLTIFVCTGSLIVSGSQYHDEILFENHNSLVGGHKGVPKTYQRIVQKYYWKSLKKEVERFVKHCVQCHQRKFVRVKHKDPMIITYTPTESSEKIDIYGPLPITR